MTFAKKRTILVIITLCLLIMMPVTVAAATKYASVTISNISFTGGNALVNPTSAQYISFDISDDALTTNQRSYYVTVAAGRGNTQFTKASGTVTIPKGKKQTNVKLPISFSDIGMVYMIINVYDPGRTKVLSTKSWYEKIHAIWKIDIVLHKNRFQPGTLTLYQADGSVVRKMNCLGRSASNASPMVYEGNTPTGQYAGILGSFESDQHAYGPYRPVELSGVSGDIIRSGRSGIWIHGGAPDTNGNMRPTNGCVRITNDNELNLNNDIAHLTNTYYLSQGVVIIREEN